MTWTTTPKTWNSGDNLSSSTTLNSEFRDRFNDLYARPGVHTLYQSASAAYSLTATTWTDVDATNLIATMTTNANSRVLVEFMFTITNITGGGLTISFDVTNGTSRSGGTLGAWTTIQTGMCIVKAVFTGVANASQTYKLQYQVSSGTTVTVGRTGYVLQVHAQEF